MKNYKTLLLLPFIALASCSQEKPADKPNILIILSDDMGYSDISCFGGEIPTPYLDRLAENGVRFTQFYNTTRCSPSRASLLTGLYPHEAGVGTLAGRDRGSSGYIGHLNDSCVTIPEVLTRHGYFTGMTGKWHTGLVRHSWPINRGFQRFWGVHNFVDSYFTVLRNCDVFENDQIIIPPTETPRLGAGEGEEWYTTDVFTTKALKHIDEALDQGKPFFQYVAYNVPHWPLEAHDDVIEKYLDRYNDGYESLRREKYERMKKMDIIDTSWDLPMQVTPDWESLPDSIRLDTEFRRAIYAAQIDIMDYNIGRLIRHLEQKNALDKTIIIFLSDNGCSAEPAENIFGFSWGKNTRWNYEEWRKDAHHSSSQGRVWAITSNTPFRRYKRFTHEGGIATPLIIHWPDGIMNPGSIDRKPGHLIDLMATVVDITGAEYPLERNGIPIKPMRGISLFENLKGREGHEHEMIFWEHNGRGALRMGKWKIVSADLNYENDWELYDLEADRTETNDLSKVFPEKRKELIDSWIKMAYETGALPSPFLDDRLR